MKKKRWIAILICLVMMVSLLPVQISAEENEGTYLDYSEDYETGFQEVSIPTDCISVTSDMTTLGESGKTTWYVADSDVTFSARITIQGDVHLILMNGCTLDANKGGVQVSGGNSLTIYGQSGGTGTLKAKGGSNRAGIGVDGGTITINGGTVTAAGGSCGAGIGGNYSGNGGTVIINGGTVTATGGRGASGIGKGYNGGGQGSFSTGTKGNAFIVASSIGNQSQKNSWSGVIIIGNSGQVYGENITLTTNATLASDKTLTIPEGTTLTVGKDTTLTNNGTIDVDGTLKFGEDGYGSITGSGVLDGIVCGDFKVTGNHFFSYNDNDHVLTIRNGAKVTIAMANDGKETITDTICVEEDAGAEITLAGVNINVSDKAAFKIEDNSTGAVKIILQEGTVNTLKSGSGFAGLQKNGTAENSGSLTITGTGTLYANGGENGAGIGGGRNESGRNITISNGGFVVAIGGAKGTGYGAGAAIGDGGSEDANGTELDEKNFSNAVVMRQSGEDSAMAGRVYGKSTLTADAEVPENVILTIPASTALTLQKGMTLTNLGTIENYSGDGAVFNYSLSDDGEYGILTGGGSLFSIITESMITIKASDDGEMVITVEDGETTLTENTDYELIIKESDTEDDTYDINIKGIGNYKGEVKLTRKKVSYLDYSDNYEDGFLSKDAYASPVTNDMTTLGESGKTTWYVADSDVTFSARITIQGDVHLILMNGYTLDANKGGVQVSGGNSLTIYGQSGGIGTLNAKGGSDQAGIGGGGTITINGGTVTAAAGSSAAGIGGGRMVAAGTVIINGGTVTATGSGSRGISGGYNGGQVSFSTGTKGNAFIVASGIGDTSKMADWSGVIIRGNSGQVYGTNITLTTNATLASGKILTIPEGTTLTVGRDTTLTNNGTIYVEGTLNFGEDDYGTLTKTENVHYLLTVTGGQLTGTDTYNEKTYAVAGKTIDIELDEQVGKTAVCEFTVNGESMTGSSFEMPAQVTEVKIVSTKYINTPGYVVTIPEKVTMNSVDGSAEAVVKAEDINVAAGWKLTVGIDNSTSFTMKNEDEDELNYAVTKKETTVKLGKNGTSNTTPFTAPENAVSSGSSVLEISGGTADSSGSTTLVFDSKAAKYPGVYTGTVTFTVSVAKTEAN